MRMGDAARAVVRRGGRAVQNSAVPLGLLLSAVLVWQTSNAAFTARTDNSGNSFASGVIRLSDNDTGNKMFDVSGMKPADKIIRCIRVIYGDATKQNLPMTVRMYSSGYTSPLGTAPYDGELGAYINLVIEVADDVPSWTYANTGTDTCPGTLTNVKTVFDPAKPAGQTAPAGTLKGFGGYTGWSSSVFGEFETSTTTTATASRIYRITAELQLTAPDSVQGASAGINFWWEAQNK